MNSKTLSTLKKLSFASVLLFLSCDKVEEALSDKEAPQVISTIPLNDANGTDLTTSISVTFSEPIKSSSVSQGIFNVKENNAEIDGTVTLSSNIITFLPNSSLKAGSNYDIIISGSIEDMAGNTMSSDYSYSFQTKQTETSNPVLAAFDYTVNGFEVRFSNTSTNASSYSWSFGDGTVSSEVNPNKTYDENGTFTVALTAIGANNSNTKSQTVTIDVEQSSNDLPDSYTGSWYNVNGIWIYEIDQNSNGKYIRTNNIYYYYDPETDLNKLELSSGTVYEIEALGNGSPRMFYLKQDGNSNRIKITNSASLNNFVEYGHVVGVTLKRATYDGGEFILTNEGTQNIWEERKTGGGTYLFTEENYDDWSVYLVRDDGVKIQLGVWGMVINITLPGQEKEKIYDIIEVFK